MTYDQEMKAHLAEYQRALAHIADALGYVAEPGTSPMGRAIDMHELIRQLRECAAHTSAVPAQRDAQAVGDAADDGRQEAA